MERIPRAGRSGAHLAWLAAAVGVAAVLAFEGGQLAADAVHPRAATARPEVAGRPAPAPPGLAAERPSRPAPAGLASAPASPPAPGRLPVPPAGLALTPQGRPTPALVARVAEEASRGLERAKEELVARCVPVDRPAGPAAGARFTFNLTFDAAGREIARGISEDRRAPDPEVAGCLRRFPLGSLRVSAPGASVGVRVAMTLP